MKRLASNKYFAILLLFFLSIAFLLLLSPSTSVIYNDKQYGGDGMIFHIIGRYWFEDGTLPYVGLWDLKGPIIYLLNGFGFLISHTQKGLFILQTIFLFWTLYVTFLFFKLRYNAISSLVLTFGASLCMALNYECGDCVEEFTLPFLVLSYYYIYKWGISYESGQIDHNSKYALLYGLTLGVSLLTRLTNAIGMMGAVAFICIVLIYNKKWKNLLSNAMEFVIGFLIILLPFVLYFSANDALDDMWYGTVLYNMEYAKNSVGGHSLNSILSIYLYGTVLLIYGIYKTIIEKKYIIGGLWASSIVLMQYWLFGSNGYAHYGLLCYPALCVLINEIYLYLRENHIPMSYFQVVFLLFGMTVFGLRFQRTIKYSAMYNDNSAAQSLIEIIPEEERSSVIMYNCNVELYLVNNIKPDNPYFGLQDFESQRGPSLKRKIYESYDRKKTKWVLFRSMKDKSVIEPILKEKYSLFHQEGNYQLYKINN